MQYRTAVQEFASMLKIATNAMQGLTRREKPSQAVEEITDLLHRTNEIADRLTVLSREGQGNQDELV